MGLDITAYSKLEFAKEATDDWEEVDRMYNEGYVHLYQPYPQYKDRTDGWKDGFYICNGERFDYRAGSYSGYNQRRNMLSIAALGAQDSSVWESPEEYKANAVSLLVNFSDCEGFIGPVTSAKIYLALMEIPEKRLENWEEWERRWLNDVIQGFEIASDHGAVRFH